jgi:hypothetical protein
MQCRDAQFYIRLRRHANDELGADITTDLDRHCVECPACLLDFRQTLAFDRAVATAMKSVVVPVGLRDKLLTKVLVHRGTVLRRKAYQIAALAASLFLVIGLAFGLFSVSRPKLDLNQLAYDADDQIQEPEKAIQNWLVAQHFPAQLPLPFNPDLLVSLGSEKIKGRDVPVIVFRGSTEHGFAKIYLFRKNGEFNLDPQSLRDGHASIAHAMVLPEQPNNSEFVYVIVYTVFDLKQFFKAPSALSFRWDDRLRKYSTS